MQSALSSAGATAPVGIVVPAIPTAAGNLSPLAEHAKLAALAGLIVFPTRGKKPLVAKWQRFKRPPLPATIDGWSLRWPDADWGINTGASGLVVADWDSHDLDAAIGLFGPVPFAVRSARGWHLYYRHAGGLPSRDLRSIGLECQIKSLRGFVVGWGSRHPDSGFVYCVARGTLDDLARLPEFDVDALERLTGRRAGQDDVLRSPGDRVNTDGRRCRLFDYLRGLGANGLLPTEADVIEAARDYNERQNSPPKHDREVVNIARGVWRYIAAGKCRPPKGARSLIAPTAAELAAIAALDPKAFNVADAVMMFCTLKAANGKRAARGEPFAIAAKAMADAQVVPGWTDPKRYRRATQALIAAGVIEKVEDVTLARWVGPDGKPRTTGRSPALYQFSAPKEKSKPGRRPK